MQLFSIEIEILLKAHIVEGNAELCIEMELSVL